MAAIPHDFPPVVYLPCVAHVAEPAQAEVEMRTTRDGRVALLAYSALDRLHNCCGESQAWLVMPTPVLASLHERRPFDLLLLDVMIPVDRRTAGVRERSRP
jgi:hypothetical protein